MWSCVKRCGLAHAPPCVNTSTKRLSVAPSSNATSVQRLQGRLLARQPLLPLPVPLQLHPQPLRLQPRPRRKRASGRSPSARSRQKPPLNLLLSRRGRRLAPVRRPRPSRPLHPRHRRPRRLRTRRPGRPELHVAQPRLSRRDRALGPLGGRGAPATRRRLIRLARRPLPSRPQPQRLESKQHGCLMRAAPRTQREQAHARKRFWRRRPHRCVKPADR